MFTTWNDFDRTFDALAHLLRRSERTYDEHAVRTTGGVFSARLVETDGELVFTADLPGVAASALDVKLHDGVLTVRGERAAVVPDGFQARRIERGAATFARSFSLPSPVDPERTSARLADGTLTVRMVRSEVAKPRTIEVVTGAARG